MAVDLVCGKDVDDAQLKQAVGTVPGGAPEVDPTAGTRRFYNGKWYYFCSLTCRQEFLATPDEFIARATP